MPQRITAGVRDQLLLLEVNKATLTADRRYTLLVTNAVQKTAVYGSAHAFRAAATTAVVYWSGRDDSRFL